MIVDGVYVVEFENMDGLLLDSGIVVFEAGHFEGGTGGYHYAGTFEIETSNRFRAEGSVSKNDDGAQKVFVVFGDECSYFQMILVGHVEGPVIRGLLLRLDKPYTTLRFRLTAKSGLGKNES
jgi:hypothetical protein